MKTTATVTIFAICIKSHLLSQNGITIIIIIIIVVFTTMKEWHQPYKTDENIKCDDADRFNHLDDRNVSPLNVY